MIIFPFAFSMPRHVVHDLLEKIGFTRLLKKMSETYIEQKQTSSKKSSEMLKKN